MWQNPPETADKVIFGEEILNGKNPQWNYHIIENL